jgi:hypothetical protein
MKQLLCLLLLWNSFLTEGFCQRAQDSFYVKKNFFTGMQVYQGVQRLNIGAAADAMQANPEAYQLMKSAQKNRTWSTITSIVGGALIGYPLGTSLAGAETNWTPAYIGGAVVIVSAVLNAAFEKKTRTAVEVYNNGLRSKAYRSAPQLHLNFGGTNIGLALKF